MNLILYDFDGTIYNGDSSVDFFLFCLAKKPLIVIYIPKMIISVILYKIHIIDKTKMKRNLFSFLNIISDVDEIVKLFWDKHIHKIKQFYIKRNHSKDIIISASPVFLLQPIANIFKVKELIATVMDKNTGKIHGINCYGEEKVQRFLKKYKKSQIYEMYSDSYADLPLLLISKKSFIVKGDDIIEYKKQ